MRCVGARVVKSSSESSAGADPYRNCPSALSTRALNSLNDLDPINSLMISSTVSLLMRPFLPAYRYSISHSSNKSTMIIPNRHSIIGSYPSHALLIPHSCPSHSLIGLTSAMGLPTTVCLPVGLPPWVGGGLFLQRENLERETLAQTEQGRPTVGNSPMAELTPMRESGRYELGMSAA